MCRLHERSSEAPACPTIARRLPLGDTSKADVPMNCTTSERVLSALIQPTAVTSQVKGIPTYRVLDQHNLTAPRPRFRKAWVISNSVIPDQAVKKTTQRRRQPSGYRREHLLGCPRPLLSSSDEQVRPASSIAFLKDTHQRALFCLVSRVLQIPHSNKNWASRQNTGPLCKYIVGEVAF